MKKLSTILFLLVAGFVCAQQKPAQFVSGLNVRGVARDQFQVDSFLYLPLTDTVRLPGRAGVIVTKSSDNKAYLYDGSIWHKLSDAFDLALKLNISDTAAMLSPYLRKAAPGSDTYVIFNKGGNFYADSVYTFNEFFPNFCMGCNTPSVNTYITGGGFNSGNLTLSPNATGSLFAQGDSVVLQANPGTNNRVSLQTNNAERLGIKNSGEWVVNGSAGSAGQVPTSQGPGLPTIWGTPAGGGNTNSNIGAGYRWAVPFTNNIKTFFAGSGLTLDSSSFANALTVNMATGTPNTLAGYNGSGNFSGVSIGSNLTLSGGTLSATGGGGSADTTASYYTYRNNLKNTNSHFGGVRSNDSLLRVAAFGESIFWQPQIFETPAKQYINAKNVMRGPGFVGVNFLSTDLSFTVPSDSNWTTLLRSAGGIGPNLATLVSQTGAKNIQIFPATTTEESYHLWDHLDVFYVDTTGGGSFSVIVDGVILDTISTAGTYNFAVKTYAVSYGQHNLTIHPISEGTNHTRINGFKLYSGRNGVEVDKIAQGGMETTDVLFGMDSTLFVNQWKAIGFDVVIIHLGINDLKVPIPADSFKINMQHIINRFRAANPLCDIILVAPANFNTAPASPTVFDYRDRLQQLAQTNYCTLFDKNKLYGDSLSIIEARGIYQGDGVHESNLGGYMLTENILSGIPFFSGRTNYYTNPFLGDDTMRNFSNVGAIKKWEYRGNNQSFSNINALLLNNTGDGITTTRNSIGFGIHGTPNYNTGLQASGVTGVDKLILGTNANNMFTSISNSWDSTRVAGYMQLAGDSTIAPISFGYKPVGDVSVIPVGSINKFGQWRLGSTIVSDQGAGVYMDYTSSVRVPLGTTAQRPASIGAANLRYNGDLNQLEYRDNAGWQQIANIGNLPAASQWTTIPTNNVGFGSGSVGRVTVGSTSNVYAEFSVVNNVMSGNTTAEIIGTSATTSNPYSNDYPTLAIGNATTSTTGNAAFIGFVDNISPSSQFVTSGIGAKFSVHGGTSARSTLDFITQYTDGIQPRVTLFPDGNMVIGKNATEVTSAVLAATDTSHGFLVPRLTASQRDANISSPAIALLIYNTTVDSFQYHPSSGGWVDLGGGGLSSNKLFFLGQGYKTVTASNDTLFIKRDTAINSISLSQLPDSTLQWKLTNDSAISGTGNYGYQTNSAGRLGWYPVPISGSYTPTLTNTANVTSTTLTQAYYTRVGNVVTVVVGGSTDITSNTTNSIITITLPINTSVTSQAMVGTGSIAMNAGSSGYAGATVSVATGSTATLNFNPSAGAGLSANFSCTFMYTTQ